MASAAATRTRRGRPGLLRFVLLGGLVVAAVIAGLLAMHTLNLHGTPAAQAPAAAVSVAEVHQGVADHSTAGSHGSSGTAHDPGGSCTDCGSDGHLSMAMACVLALLLVLLVLVPPRMLPGWMHLRHRPVLAARYIDRILPRAPSLHVLCISRT